MSVQFPSDSNPVRRRKSRSIIPLLIMAAIAFMIFRSTNSNSPPNETRTPATNGSYRESDFPEARLPESAIRKRGDWGLDGVATKSNSGTPRPNGSVANGDWEMSDGPTKKNSTNIPNNAKQNSSVKSGDWGLDEVTASKDSNGRQTIGDSRLKDASSDPSKKSESSMTKKGDWSFEEIDNE